MNQWGTYFAKLMNLISSIPQSNSKENKIETKFSQLLDFWRTCYVAEGFVYTFLNKPDQGIVYSPHRSQENPTNTYAPNRATLNVASLSLFVLLSSIFIGATFVYTFHAAAALSTHCST